MWKSLNISTKIFLCIFMLCAGYFTSMLYVVSDGKKVGDRLNDVSDVSFPAAMNSRTILTLFKEQVKLYRDSVMLGETEYVEKADLISNDILQTLNTIEAYPGLTPSMQSRLHVEIQKITDYTRSASAAYEKMASDIHVDIDESQQIARLSFTIDNELTRLSDDFEKMMKTELSSVIRSIHYRSTVNIVVFFIFTGVSFLFMWMIIRYSIIRPLRQTVDVLKRISLGDVSVRLKPGKDEIGEMGEALNVVVASLDRKVKTASKIAAWDLDVDVHIASEYDTLGKALNKMVLSLNKIAAGLIESARQVDRGSKLVAESSQELNRETMEQSASLEEASAAIETVGSQTYKNAEHARKANLQTEQAFQAAILGAGQITEMVSAMEHISDSTHKIEKINKTIDDIAFQINLLSLNAAIEAARAGKHGKGFAVVAQEVRNLAMKSAKAVQETSMLINSAVINVDHGNRIAKKTSESFSNIHYHIAIAAELVGQIASLSNDQAFSVNQISSGLGQLVISTQKNATAAEQTSTAAEQLAMQAAYVKSLMSMVNIKPPPPHFGTHGAEPFQSSLEDHSEEIGIQTK